ncbi:MAG: hypothetical protein VX438_07790 [Planctomycetota bacterium]|nr:hypothetical protein [Planctomycetota bacterium]
MQPASADWLQALNSELDNKNLFNELGTLINERIENGLVNQSLSYFMIVRNHVPNLLPDQMIPIDHLEDPGPS